MEFEFTTQQGKNAKVIIEAMENGMLSVKEFYLEDTKIYEAKSGNYGWCELLYAYDKNSNKIFSMEIKKNVCKQYLKINNINSKVTKGYVKIDNKDLENLYNEWPKQVIRENNIKANKKYEELKKSNEKIKAYYSTSIGFRINDELLKKSSTIRTMQELIGKYLPREEMKKFKTSTDFDDYSITDYYELTISELEYIFKIAKDIELKYAEKRDILRAKEKAIFDTAKVTGEKQKLYSYSVACNKENEACDIDIITVYALPNGDTEEVRSCTW